MSSKAQWLLGMAICVCCAGLAFAQFNENDTIPGYLHRNGAGSRVDVRTDGIHDGTTWTVVFRRNLMTGDLANDIQFAPGGSYSFQVATWDNSGDESHDISEASNVFEMQIPDMAGPLVFSGTPGILTSLSGEYLSSGEIRITAAWPDATKNDRRREWTYSGSSWSQSSENEDRMAFIWDLQADAFASAGTCLTMCHPPVGMYTAPNTKVDTWQWKATRSNPSGYSDDKYWDDGAAGTESGRHNDPGQAPYADNVANGLPAYMSSEDPGASAAFVFELPPGIREAIAWLNGGWNEGDTLPGYVGRRGAGSRVDTRSVSTHDGTSWAVTFRRKLDTGDPASDIIFVPGGTYSFQVATWDNAGDEAHNTSELMNVYTMTVPSEPGPLTFSGTPGLFNSLSGNLLSSDEVEITVSWNDATRSDSRKKWSYDGTTWTQSTDNEDRVAFIWDMQADGFASAGTCASMCHPPVGMYTAPGTKVDTWHWKATRTASTWFTDDKYWDDGNEGTESGRRDDPGMSVYLENASNGGVPTYMSASGPGTSAQFLFTHPAATGWQRAVPFHPLGVQPTDPCVDSTAWLCLLGNRFRIELSAKNPRDDRTGTGYAISYNDKNGFFAIPDLTADTDNFEVFVKVLDGRAINNRFWVFYGGLTDFEYTVTVTDTESGKMKTYFKAGETYTGGADTNAF